MSLMTSSAFGLAARLVALAVAAGTQFWLAHEMGPAGYGGFVLAIVIQGTVALVANVGLGSSLAYRVARDPGAARRLLIVGLVVSAMSAVVILPLVWIVLVASDISVFPALDRGWVAAALVAVPLRLFYEDLSGICVGLGRLGITFLQTAATPALLLLALGEAQLTGGVDAGSVAAAWLVAGVASVGLALLLTVRALPPGGSASADPRPGRLRELLTIAWQQTLNLGAWWLITRTSRAIAGAVAGPDAAGRFGVSSSIVETLSYVPAVIQLALFSRIARVGSSDAAEEVRRTTRVAMLGVALASLPVWIGGAWAIRTFLGEPYQDSVLALAVLIPGVIALTPVTITGVYFLAHLGRPGVNLVPSAVGLAALAPLVWSGTERWGVVGAAAGTSLAYVLAGAIAVAIFSSRTGSAWTSTVIPTLADVRSLMAYRRMR